MPGRRHMRTAGWACAALLALAPLGLRPTSEPRPAAGGPLRRLLGPVADLVANVQWIRFERARLAGRQELAIVRAESALSFAPQATAGWELFASHLGLFLGSTEREPEPARRLLWVRAGLEVARRGEETADDPASLAILRGVILITKLEQDAELPWPGGSAAMLEEAALAFERAGELGHPSGAELARNVRARIPD